MKSEELRNKKDTELHRALAEARRKLREVRFEVAAGRAKNVHELRAARRTVARILTELTARRSSSQSAQKS